MYVGGYGDNTSELQRQVRTELCLCACVHVHVNMLMCVFVM